MELLYGLPHAEPVAALHGDHQHLPSLSPSPDAQTEQKSSQCLLLKLQSQGHLCTNQTVWSVPSVFLAFTLSPSHLGKMACHWKAVCPPYINHYRISPCLGFITSDFTQGTVTPLPLSWKNSSDLLLPLGSILVHSLVFHPRLKARLCLSIPWVACYLSANRVLWGWTEL